MMKKMEKVRKKADTILETQDVSEKEKMYQIKSYVSHISLSEIPNKVGFQSNQEFR